MIIISSPLAFPGATIKAQEVPFPASLAGAISYVGHPATRALIEALGAETLTGKWAGPAIGEKYLAVPLAQNNREGGYTQDQAIESISQLRAILLERIA
jgi:hypothetical protein